MSGGNRFLYDTAMVLDQEFLDACHDNLSNRLEMGADIEGPTEAKSYTNPSGNLVQVAATAHGFHIGQFIIVEAADDAGLVGTWQVSTSGFTANAFRFDKGLAVSPASGSLTFKNMVRASDRNKYIGPFFYEALLKFPTVKRTIGEWLAPTLEFSKLELRLSNVDGRFNRFLPAGNDYNGWIGRRVEMSIGLRDVAATYTTVFRGAITPEGGFGRDIQAFHLTARDDFEAASALFPSAVFTDTTYPDIADSVIGKTIPVIWGDYTTALGDFPARVPAFIVNGKDPDVIDEGGARNNVQLVISANPNRVFDTANVWLKRSSTYYLIDSADVVNVNADKNYFEIDQEGLTDIDGDLFVLETSDEFYVLVEGKDLGAYSDNFVWIARDILTTYGGVASGDFHANWATFRDKASPPESAIAAQLCRHHQAEAKSALEVALSLLEQVRLEAFVDRDRLFKINSLHFDDFVAAPTQRLKNWDLAKDTFRPNINVTTNYNRLKGFYSKMPDTGKEQFETSYLRNQAAIDQNDGEFTRGLVYPNHYVLSDVENQVRETLKLTSSGMEIIETELTWRSLLLDIGDFVLVTVMLDSTSYVEVPMLVREIGYNPQGLRLPIKLWSFQLVPFTGYAPGYDGTVGGASATITVEP